MTNAVFATGSAAPSGAPAHGPATAWRLLGAVWRAIRGIGDGFADRHLIVMPYEYRFDLTGRTAGRDERLD